MGGIGGTKGKFEGAVADGARFDKDNESQWDEFNEDVNLWDADWSAGPPKWIDMDQYRKEHETAWKKARENCPAVAAARRDVFTQQ